MDQSSGSHQDPCNTLDPSIAPMALQMLSADLGTRLGIASEASAIIGGGLTVTLHDLVLHLACPARDELAATDFSFAPNLPCFWQLGGQSPASFPNQRYNKESPLPNLQPIPKSAPLEKCFSFEPKNQKPTAPRSEAFVKGKLMIFCTIESAPGRDRGEARGISAEATPRLWAGGMRLVFLPPSTLQQECGPR